jgi:Uma2 family endonuclease
MPSIVSLETAPAAPPAAGDDGERYEIIDGQRVEMPPMSAYASVLASRLVLRVFHFAESHHLGEAFTDTLLRLPLKKVRNRRPDGAFVSFQRWPKGRPIPNSENAWDVVPELVIEVISPTDWGEDIIEKIEEYFDAGVQLVWVVYPRRRLIHVYESLTQIRVLRHTDVLDGGKVLPDFRLPLTDLFQEESTS